AAVCGRAAMWEEHARPGAPGSEADGGARRRVERPSVEGPRVEGPSGEGPSGGPRLVAVPAGGWLGADAGRGARSLVPARVGGAGPMIGRHRSAAGLLAAPTPSKAR